MPAHLDNARQILHENDRGNYTVPSKDLYPFLWNWDSCLTALGFSHFDEQRAWQEIATLFANQWEDGMVPHIVFYENSQGYFPGPEVWDTGRAVPTSGITQPPVAGFVVRRLLARARDSQLARRQAKMLLPKILAWHQWLYRCRDPQGEGLVAVLHPWETGRDNAIDWDAPLKAVPVDGAGTYTRRDTQHTDPDHRPTNEQYDRYISLVRRFRALDWDNSRLHQESPFRVIDPGFNAILIRSSADMAVVAESLGEPQLASQYARLATTGAAALEKLWSDSIGQYLGYDRVADCPITSPSVGGILPILASGTHARALAQRLENIASHCRYLVPSHHPLDSGFDPQRYWRGPAWLIINYLISTGLRESGETALADRIVHDSIALIEQSGFAEYYSPIDARPCGGGRFTWTAAMAIELLQANRVEGICRKNNCSTDA